MKLHNEKIYFAAIDPVLVGMIAIIAVFAILVFALIFCLIKIIVFFVNRQKAVKKKIAVRQKNDITKILGFDPYRKVEVHEKDIYGAEEENKIQSDYARKIVECIREVGVLERILQQYDNLIKLTEEGLNRTRESLNEIQEISDTNNAVNLKLKDEISFLSVTKKSTRKNKRRIADIQKEIAANSERIIEIGKDIDIKTHDISLINEALDYMKKCCETEKERYEMRLNEIEQAHGEGNVELSRVRDYNRACEILTRDPNLKSNLISINVKYREYKDVCAEIVSVEREKTELKELINENFAAMGKTVQADVSEISKKIASYNERFLTLEQSIPGLLISKNKLNEQLSSIKKNIEDLVQMNKFSVDDVLLAEDKVVGDLKYKALVNKLNDNKRKAIDKINNLEKKYQSLSQKLSRTSKRKKTLRNVLEVDIRNISTDLANTRTELKKIQDDVDYSLPNISPLSIMQHGDGYICVCNSGRSSKITFDYKERINEIKSSYIKTIEIGRPVSVQRRQEMLLKLEQLANTISLNAFYIEPVADNGHRKENLRTAVIQMRNQLQFISSKQDAVDFRKKLYEFGRTLSEQDLEDNVLSDLIVKTMNDAKMLGEQANYIYTKTIETGGYNEL